jgi:hypothetical protein
MPGVLVAGAWAATQNGKAALPARHKANRMSEFILWRTTYLFFASMQNMNSLEKGTHFETVVNLSGVRAVVGLYADHRSRRD